MTVSDPTAFVEDADVEAALEEAIAETASVSTNFVTVVLELDSSGGRRLQDTGLVKASYEVALPEDVEVDIDGVESALSAISETTIAGVIATKLQEKGLDYTVEVEWSRAVTVNDLRRPNASGAYRMLADVAFVLLFTVLFW
jgi:hypothetical protein